jgi:hypothetical protein
MRRFRFHLGTLVILVLFLGVGLAALRESNETWDSSIFSISVGVLLISILLAVHRSENKRAFWLGFALFGSTSLGLSLAPSTESRLITTRALAYLDSKVPRAARSGFGYLDFDNDGDTDLFVVNGLPGSNGTTIYFVRIGHSLIAVVAALLGGELSRYFYMNSRHGTTGPVPAPVSISSDSGV